MRWMIFLGLLSLLLVSFTPIAPPNTIQELQAQYRLLEALHEQGQLRDSIYLQERQALEAWALERFDLDLQSHVLDQAVNAQRVDWLGSALYIAATLVLLAILAPLLQLLVRLGRRWLRLLWNWKPIRLVLIQLGKFLILIWEPATYFVLLAVLYLLPYELPILMVSLLLSSLTSFSVYIRVAPKQFKRLWATLLAWCFVVIWGCIAYWFDHTWVGVLSVGALLAALGLSLFALPNIKWLDYKKFQLRLMLQMLLISLGLTLLTALIFYIDAVPPLTALRLPLRPFEFGLTTLLPLAYFLSLMYLTLVDELYKASNGQRYALRFLTFSLTLLTLVLAVIFQIGSLFWMSAFFSIFWLSERYYRLLYKTTGPILTGLFIATGLTTGGYWLKRSLPEVVQFLADLGW